MSNETTLRKVRWKTATVCMWLAVLYFLGLSVADIPKQQQQAAKAKREAIQKEEAFQKKIETNRRLLKERGPLHK